MKSKATLKILLAASVMGFGLSQGALAQNTVKIGSVLSATGPSSFLGEPEDKTLRIYVDKINAAGGVAGKKIELVIYDDGGDANKARTFATRLIEDDEVIAMVGGTTTGATMAMIPVVRGRQDSFHLARGRHRGDRSRAQVRLQDAAHRQDGLREDLRGSEEAQSHQDRPDLRHGRLRRFHAGAMREGRTELRHADRRRRELWPA